MTTQIRQIRLERNDHRVPLDGANGRSCALREPGFRASLGFVEVQAIAEGGVLLLSVAAAEADEPGVGAPSKAQEGAGAEALPIRLATTCQLLSIAFAGKIGHGISYGKRRYILC